jgi:hypothetical protein
VTWLRGLNTAPVLRRHNGKQWSSTEVDLDGADNALLLALAKSLTSRHETWIGTTAEAQVALLAEHAGGLEDIDLTAHPTYEPRHTQRVHTPRKRACLAGSAMEDAPIAAPVPV